jgi:1-acyl-sn-glycerol-3-phosphate acyltransferase
MKKTVFSSKRSGKKLNLVLYVLTRSLGSLVVKILFKVQKQGTENLPRNSAFILLPKHQHWLDIPLIAWATPRPLYYMAKHELFSNPLSGWFLGAIGGIPINRGKLLASRGSLVQMLALLASGAGIVIFPEGTYYRNQVGQGRPGLIKLIRSRIAVPFIPVGIRYENGKGRKQVKVKFGKPLEPDAGLTTKLFLEKVMNEIAILSEL